MTPTEWVLVAGLAVNTAGLGVVLFKLVWGSGTHLQMQFNAVGTAFTDKISTVQAEFRLSLQEQTSNFGQAYQAIHDRIHQIELAAMESRAMMAETYMRRESYYQASQELKRDVQAANSDLKTEVHAGFQKLEKQVDDLTVMVHQIAGAGRTGHQRS